MSAQSLEGRLQSAGDPVAMVRNSQIGPYVYPKVPSEFSNWRDEQHAWRETSCLFDQSHHMTDLYVSGPDALRLLSDLGVNSFDGFAVDKAKQFVCCNPNGYVIGDAILFFLAPDRLSLVGRPSAHNWVQYHAETGGYDVDARARRALGRQPRGAKALPLPGPGPERPGGAAAGHRRAAAGDQVLQHGRAHDRGPRRPRAPPRHVRRAGPRALRPLGGGRRRAGGDRRGGRGARPAPGRARASTPRTRSSRGGFRARSPRSSPATT